MKVWFKPWICCWIYFKNVLVLFFFTEAPVIRRPPTNQIVNVGQDVSLPCQPKGSANMDVTWLQNGREISNDEHYVKEGNSFYYSNTAWVFRHLRPLATQLFLLKAYSCWQQRRHQSSALLALCDGYPLVTSGFPLQKTSNVKSISMSLCPKEHLHPSTLRPSRSVWLSRDRVTINYIMYRGDIEGCVRKYNTAKTSCNMVIFHQNTHKGHSTAHPDGRAVECPCEFIIWTISYTVKSLI